jgi:hypothetical protein
MMTLFLLVYCCLFLNPCCRARWRDQALQTVWAMSEAGALERF